MIKPPTILTLLVFSTFSFSLNEIFLVPKEKISSLMSQDLYNLAMKIYMSAKEKGFSKAGLDCKMYTYKPRDTTKEDIQFKRVDTLTSKNFDLGFNASQGLIDGFSNTNDTSGFKSVTIPGVHIEYFNDNSGPSIHVHSIKENGEICYKPYCFTDKSWVKVEFRIPKHNETQMGDLFSSSDGIQKNRACLRNHGIQTKNANENKVIEFLRKNINRVAEGFSPSAPTTPRMRVRTGRFTNHNVF